MYNALVLLFLISPTTAAPTAVFPINSQVPPVSRVSRPFQFTFSGSTFSSPANNITYILTSAPAWLELDSFSRTFTGTPTTADEGSSNFSLVASDENGSTSMPVTFVTAIEPGPGLGLDVALQLSRQGIFSDPDRLILAPESPINISFSHDTFTNTNPDTIFYANCANNTPLPSWLHFDPDSLLFSGVAPQAQAAGTITQDFGVHLIASDVAGFSGAVATFNIVVESHVFAFRNTSYTLQICGGQNVQYQDLSAGLSLDGNPITPGDLTHIQGSAPAWLSLNPESLVLSGTAPGDVSSSNFTITVTDKYGDQAEATIVLEALFPAGSDGTASTSTTLSSSQTAILPEPTAPNPDSADRQAPLHPRKRRWLVAAIIGPTVLVIAIVAFWYCSRHRQRKRRSSPGLIASVRNRRPLSEKFEEYQIIAPQAPQQTSRSQSVVRPPRVELSKRLSRWRWSGVDFQRHSQIIEYAEPSNQTGNTSLYGKRKRQPIQSTRQLGLQETHSWLSLSSNEGISSPSPPPKSRKRKRRQHQSTSTWAGSSGPLSALRQGGGAGPVLGHGHGRIFDHGPSLTHNPFSFANKLPGRGHGSGVPAALSYIRRSWQKASQSSWTSTSGGTTTTTSSGSRIRMPGSQKSQDLAVWPRPPTSSRALNVFLPPPHLATRNEFSASAADDQNRRSTIRIVDDAQDESLNPVSKQMYIKQRARKRNRENALFAAGPSARLSSLSKIGKPSRSAASRVAPRFSVSSVYSQQQGEDETPGGKPPGPAVTSPLRETNDREDQFSERETPLHRQSFVPVGLATPSQTRSFSESPQRRPFAATARAYLTKRSRSRLRGSRSSTATLNIVEEPPDVSSHPFIAPLNAVVEPSSPSLSPPLVTSSPLESTDVQSKEQHDQRPIPEPESNRYDFSDLIERSSEVTAASDVDDGRDDQVLGSRDERRRNRSSERG